MNKIRISIAFICVFAITSIASAQNYNYKLDRPFLTKRVIKVSGVCDGCQTRIERSARSVTGVTYAHWDADKQELLVEYNRARTNPEKIQQVIAAKCGAGRK